MRHPPSFWQGPDGRRHPLARLLRPLSWIYGAVVARKLAQAQPTKVGCPVICIGNLTMGGVGKTPFADSLARLVTEMGYTPHLLLRGYGGHEQGPLRMTDAHTANAVGDEACMLAQQWPVWVAKDRAQGAQAAAAAGADVILMDDGFQNPSVYKDFSFVLIDKTAGLGNGLVFPAGPLREVPDAGVARADALVLVGDGDAALPTFPSDKRVFDAHIQIDTAAIPSGPLVAFAGIGRPQKFFDSLTEAGANIAHTEPFADHHPYSPSEINCIKAKAASLGAQLVTTEKDFARLSPADAEGITSIPARMALSPQDGLKATLTQIMARNTL